MNRLISYFAALIAVCILACSSGPVFNETRDREEGSDMMCHLDGRYIAGWHQCRAVSDACCPDGTSCSKDDFVPSAAPNACRPWYGDSDWH